MESRRVYSEVEYADARSNYGLFLYTAYLEGKEKPSCCFVRISSKPKKVMKEVLLLQILCSVERVSRRI